MELKNKQRIIYWTLTLPIALMMLTLAFGYLTANPQLVEAIGHLGYPPYFLTLLGIAMLLGASALLYGRFRNLAEWAYAGFAFTLISAAFSHYSSGDGATKVMLPLIALAAVLCSHGYWKHRMASPSKQSNSPDVIRNAVHVAHVAHSPTVIG
jgi:uncharacterized membrane protein YphA (DoxX/SURF4 family)